MLKMISLTYALKRNSNKNICGIDVIAGMKAKTIDTKQEVKIDAVLNHDNTSTCLVALKSKDREEYSERVFKTSRLNLIVCHE